MTDADVREFLAEQSLQAEEREAERTKAAQQAAIRDALQKR